MKAILKWLVIILPIAVLLLFGGGLWFASDQLLSPSFKGATKDLSVCKLETAEAWGEGCGNLRTTGQLKFAEVLVPSTNGYDLPGWLIKTADNGMPIATGAIVLIHAGGGDRREETRYIPFLVGRGLDVLTLDLGCQGEAPCPVPGLSYGERESRDVFSAYRYLKDRYSTVYARGSSVGAAAILVALPAMPELAGAIAENPISSFHQLIKEAPESQSMPAWGTDLLINVTMLRGRFDGLQSPRQSLRFGKEIPVLFVHSKEDKVVSYRQTQELADLYAGPKTVWLPDRGSHAAIWDVERVEYEQRLAGFLGQTQARP